MNIRQKTSSIYILVTVVSVIFLWNFEVKFGFFPTDESRTLGLTQRLFFKQTPHVDFSYQSFMGSMYLHLYALLIPKYKLAILRIISILMVHFYTYNVLNLTNLYRTKNLYFKIFLWLAATYLNIHWYDFFIWPTIDAIFIISFGVLLLKKNKTAGLIVMGFAPLFKTPFVLSVAAYILYRNLINFKINNFIKEALISSLPSFIYISATYFSGGFNNLYQETLLSPVNWDYWNIWFHRLGFYEKELIPVLMIFVGLVFIPFKNLKIKTNFIYINCILFLFFIGFLNYDSWGYNPSLNLINLFLIFFIFIKYFKDLPDIFHALFVCYILEVGAMMSMSWVYGLWLNGTLIVLIFLFLYEKINIKNLKYFFSVLFVLISLTNVVELLNFRGDYIWKSNPARSVARSSIDLSYNLNEINEVYGPIFVDKNTYQYLKDVDECLEKIDSKNVSIFPDNPILYYLYELNNPSYLDWYEVGYVGNRRDYYNEMIFKNLNKFEGENTYLLLQSYRVPRLISELSFEEVSQIIEEPWPDYMESIFEEFYVPIKQTYNIGQTTCKSFTVLRVNN